MRSRCCGQGMACVPLGRNFKALINIHHPNVVRVRHCDLSHSQPPQWFVLMELARGEPLTNFISGEQGLLPLDTSLRITDQLLDALISFHPDDARIAAIKAQDELDENDLWELQRLEGEGLVHRDIKPQNILYERSTGQVKILDFNIASPVGSEVLTVSGTPQYQPGGVDLTAWTVDPDLFAVAVVLYELVTGRHPYADRNPTNGEPIDPRTIGDVPDWLAEFLLRGCSSEQAQRFNTAVEMRSALVLPEITGVTEPLDTLATELAARIEAEGVTWHPVGLEDLATGAILTMTGGALLLRLYRDQDELRLALEVDGDDVDALRELRRRQEAIERHSGLSLIPFESSASTWHTIMAADDAVSWVIDSASRLDFAVTDVFGAPPAEGALTEVDPGPPLDGAHPVVLLATTEWRIPLLGVPLDSGSIVRQGRTVDGRSYRALKPSPLWLPNAARLGFDHAVQGVWSAICVNEVVQPMAGEPRDDGSWMFSSPPGVETAFGQATIRATVVDDEGAAAVAISVERLGDAQATAETSTPGVVDDLAAFIRQRVGGNPAREESVTAFVSRVMGAEGVYIALGKSGTTSDGRSNYLMIRRSGPQRLGALAYVNPRPGNVDFRVPAIAAQHRAYASVRTDSTYQVRVKLDSTAAVEEALDVLADAVRHHDEALFGPQAPSVGKRFRPDLVRQQPVSPLQALIERVRQSAGGDRIAARLVAEAKARQLLESRSGRLTRAQLNELFAVLRTDLSHGIQTSTRFPGSFLQPELERLGDQIDGLNRWLVRLWGPDERDAQRAADTLFRDEGADGVLGAGLVLPAVILYLRDPNRWAPVNAPIKRGAFALGVGLGWDRARGIEGFREWSGAVHEFCRRHNLSIHEVDAIFTAADPASSYAGIASRGPSEPSSSKGGSTDVVQRSRTAIAVGEIDRSRPLGPPEPITKVGEDDLADRLPSGLPPVASPRRSLEVAFHNDMALLGRRTVKETGYRPTRFLQMIGEHGGLETAKALLRSATESDGFRELWERQRLDLTAETLVLMPKYEELFTGDERSMARRRLEEYGYHLG